MTIFLGFEIEELQIINSKPRTPLLRFLSKVAFICNLIFLVVFSMHWLKGVSQWDQALVSHLVITGYFVATAATLIVNLWTLILLLSRKAVDIPKWLQVANALFLVLQMLYFQFT